MSRSYARSLMLGVSLYAFGGLVPPGYAQVATAITPDGTLGTTVLQSGNLHDINGGTIRGSNQFHSFGLFSVGTGDIASFNGPAGIQIQNIVSRVTGGVGSAIDGTLRSTIAGANLFLLNPAGILFGPNASLDLSGSFHATTADYVKLGTDGIFFADPARATVLSVAPPSAFGFLTPTPAPIDVQAGVFDFDPDHPAFANVMQVPPGQTLSFVGGPITVGAAPGAPAGGFLFAPQGRINLVSVASAGEAGFDGTGFRTDTFARLGDITITGNSIIDGRDVFIRGGRLTIDGGAAIFPGLFVVLAGAPAAPPDGGEVNIEVSGRVDITGQPPVLVDFPGIQTIAGSPFTLTPGDVPNVRIKSSSLSVSDGAVIQTSRLGPGNPANVSIEADTVEVRNGASIAVLNAFEGPGGTLTVNAKDVTLDSAGSVGFTGLSAQGKFHPAYGQPGVPFLPFFQVADGGSITVNATGTLTIRERAQISADSFAFGKGGSVTINAGDMLLVGAGTNTAAITAQSVLAGQSGDVTINATGSIDMQDGFRISANTFGSGEGGQVNVRAGQRITMTGTSTFISSTTDQPLDSDLTGFAQLFDPFFQVFFGVATPDYPSLRAALGVAPGTGDLMKVLAALSTISDPNGNPLVAVTDFTPGTGGTLSITVPVLTASTGARIETSTAWDGNAGAVGVNVGSLTLRDGGFIGSRSGAVRLDRGLTAGTGDAGTVNIAATDTVEISGRSPTSGEGSTVTTTTFGDGQAGNISLNANRIDIANGGSVTSASGGSADGQTFVGSGNAGTVNMIAPDTISIAGGVVSTTTLGGGNAGSVLMNASNVSLTGGGQVASSTSGAGAGGTIAATASESVSISNDGSGLFSTASSTGNAGQISVSAPTLSLTDGAKISVATSGAGNAGDIALNVDDFTLGSNARVDSSTSGDGRGGIITVNAPAGTLTVNGAGMFSDASGTGPGGDINIATDQINLTSGTISATSTGTAEAIAGNINIVFGTGFDTVSSNITTNSLLADGGNISVTSTGSLLHLSDSNVTTSVQSGVGSGGNITIGSQAHPMNFLVLDDGQIRADAFGGPGGNINIFADVFLTQNSVVSASSALAAPGTIAIQAQVTDVSGALAQLPEAILQAAALLRAACTARLAEGKASSLVVAGREGVPPAPDGLLWSPVAEVGTGISAQSDAHPRGWLPAYPTVTLRSRCVR